MDFADDVAYSVHDLEDGIVGGRIDLGLMDHPDERAATWQTVREHFAWAHAERQVAHCGEVEHTLSPREFALLRALLLRPGAILSRAELEERIYAAGEEVESNAVDFLIHGLRRKFGAEVIKNVRGAGWLVERA